jgi:hypothetical protein
MSGVGTALATYSRFADRLGHRAVLEGVEVAVGLVLVRFDLCVDALGFCLALWTGGLKLGVGVVDGLLYSQTCSPRRSTLFWSLLPAWSRARTTKYGASDSMGSGGVL